MNPEFRRNAWLELTPLKLWALPLVVLAVAVIVNAIDARPAEAINWNALKGLGLVTYTIFVVWGGYKVSQTVTSEVVGGTWDMQRLAEHRPSELLAGKLFGAPVFEWLGVGAGLFLYALGAARTTPPGAIGLDLLSLTLAALWLHGVALFSSLATASALRATRRPTTNNARHAGPVIGLVLVLSWVGPGLFASLSGGEGGPHPVSWWWTMPLTAFVPMTLAMLIFWTLLGCHRLIRAELQEPVSPLPWIGFLLFLTLYLHPFVPLSEVFSVKEPLVAFFGVGAVVCGALFYPGLLGERKDLVRLRSLAAAWRRGDGKGVWTRLPLWTFTYAFYLLCVFGLAVLAPFWRTSELWVMFGVAISVGLFMLRDIAWILGLHLTPNPGRRPDLVVWFFLAVLYVLVPLLIASLGEGAEKALYFFVPALPVFRAAKETAVPLLFPYLWAVPGCVVAWIFAWPRLRNASRTT